ncbi:MAG: NUDIX domain-containing protein [Candidatus Micrarchaeota archaeon]|nr:NUDIX domain-containing protein [Candidatus Micrarchaeota archaeon]
MKFMEKQIDYAAIEREAKKDGITKHAVCAAIFREDKVLLVRRTAQDKFRAGEWELPGGKVEKGEGFKEALIRETREETNLNALEVNGYIGHSDTPILGTTMRLYMFLVRADDSEVILMPREHQDFMWVAKDRAKEYLFPDQFTRLFLSYVEAL